MPYHVISSVANLRALQRKAPAAFPYLLESVGAPSRLGRYDILFAAPRQLLQKTTFEAPFFDDFLAHWQAAQADADLDLPVDLQADLPFTGGWFFFLSYEMAAEIEPRLSLALPPYPLAVAARVDRALIVDKQTQQTFLLADLAATDFKTWQNEVMALLAENNFDPSSYSKENNFDPSSYLPQNLIADNPEAFLQAVEQIRELIVAGDVFQVNLSRAWQMQNAASIDGFALYEALTQQNPAPFSASCLLPQMHLISSSPERLVKIKNRRVETRPIAGTRRRHPDPEKDAALANELLAHVKERAEHIMLIDLERNDLGRIATADSVHVDELMTLESYAHVHHIVSNVAAILADNVTPIDVLRAVFPGGTITGCPKVRCMEIIHALEKTYRGAYTGSVGYLNHNGDLDSNILIRSFTLGEQLTFRTGAGIVFDANARHELNETENKARGLLLALAQWQANATR